MSLSVRTKDGCQLRLSKSVGLSAKHNLFKHTGLKSIQKHFYLTLFGTRGDTFIPLSDLDQILSADFFGGEN